MTIFTNTSQSNAQCFSNDNTNNILTDLLAVYDRVMVLKLFVDSDDANLKDTYHNAAHHHNNKLLTILSHIDAGFDLFAPLIDGQSTSNNEIHFFGPNNNNISPVNKLDFKVCCSARMYLDSGKNLNTGYYMYPRSSLSKTQLRLANSTGIIDAGYRGHLMGMFDVVNIPDIERRADFIGKKYDRYLQICAPNLVPIVVEIVDSKEELGGETARGDSGFGSTGS
jgi:dUTPase